MNLKTISLLLLFALQLAVPGYMIYEQQQILSQGKVYKFRSQPIDPYDPFRGRYVTLNYAANRTYVPVASPDSKLRPGDWVYVLLDTDTEGYAVLSQIMDSKPAAGQDYLYLELAWGDPDMGYRVKLPFTRYYASEETAPRIERAVGWRQREEVDNVYTQVRVLNGKATIEELYVNDLPIGDYLLQQQ